MCLTQKRYKYIHWVSEKHKQDRYVIFWSIVLKKVQQFFLEGQSKTVFAIAAGLFEKSIVSNRKHNIGKRKSQHIKN